MKTMGFEGVPEAHQMLHENRHLGKIAIPVGATSEDEGREEEGPGAIRRGRGLDLKPTGRKKTDDLHLRDFHVTPFRSQRWIDTWEPAAAKATECNATEWGDRTARRGPAALSAGDSLGEEVGLRSLVVLRGDFGDPRRGRGPLRQALLPVWCSRVVASS